MAHFALKVLAPELCAEQVRVANKAKKTTAVVWAVRFNMRSYSFNTDFPFCVSTANEYTTRSLVLQDLAGAPRCKAPTNLAGLFGETHLLQTTTHQASSRLEAS